MQLVANNIANLSTTGFRKEGVVFAEHVADLGRDAPSLSMANAEGRQINLAQGTLQESGGLLDFAIEGAGFFQIATPNGVELTRAGAFTRSPEGTLVTADGLAVLDSGGSPITVPQDRGPISAARDGTLSAAGVAFAQVGIVDVPDKGALVHTGGTRFATQAATEPVADPSIFQGFLEQSNVNPIAEISRMIEVQRAYELGQSFMDAEDGRIRAVVDTLGR